MRIECKTMRAFLDNLVGQNIFQKCVWFDLIRQSVNEAKTSVGLQASAILEYEEGGEALVQYGEDCGFDYNDGEAEKDGSKKAEENMRMLRDFCEHRQYDLRPGMIGV